MNACARPGCTGVIEDGFCSVCGMAPEASAPAPQAPAVTPGVGAAAVAASVGSTASGSARTGSTASARTGSSRSARSSRTGSTSRSSSSRRALGGSVIARPPLPPQDPLAALIPGVVPDRKRFCSNCEAKLSREEGFCPRCGQQYSLKPTLQPGDLVLGKYEIKGTIAFGGLGWIYLALDTVLSRWVVLKGLLNSKDPNMLALAVKEREFLAAVKHRAIVGIYDFITHGTQGFIVMEYVNGKTLMTLRRERGGPLPPVEAISYVLDVLPAFSYLDEHGLVYCDFKLENAMVEGDNVRLIDMGAVRHVDDIEGDVYGSRGYTAPEAGDDPTPVSDLYSVGRALAVLVLDFDFQGRHEHSLPPPEEAPIFQQHDSLYRFLLKSTHRDRDRRFQTAEEMAGQLLGVLREVALGTADVGPVPSAVFESGDLASDTSHLTTTGRSSRRLPLPRIEPDDPAAGVAIAAMTITEPARRRDLYKRALEANPHSIDLQLLATGELIAQGTFTPAARELAAIGQAARGDWRLDWYEGQLRLAERDAKRAIAAFQRVYEEFPGELAPKLALAQAYEADGDLTSALRYFDLVSRADPAYTSASFGLARCLERQGDRAGAGAAYGRVPPSSNRYAAAQMALARLLIRDHPGVPELERASAAIQGLDGSVTGLDLHQLSADLLRCAATLVESDAIPVGAGGVLVLGTPLIPTALRAAAEGQLRACAHYAPTREQRIRFIDEANRVRPLTIV